MERVIIYYDMSEDDEPFHLDEEAREAAGRKEEGAGTYLPTMTRDMTFRFENESDAGSLLCRGKR